MPGWVKNYRDIAKWEWYTKPNMAHLWQHLIREANHEDGRWQGIEIKRGQLIVGRSSLSAATGISQQSIRTCLDRLELTGEITRKSTNQFTIVTITKYDDYQSQEEETNQRPTSDQPAINQRSTTNKNDKNVRIKEMKKEIINNADPAIFQEEKTPEEPKETWRDNYQIYLKECTEGFQKIIADKKTIMEQEKFNPGINIELSIEKGFKNFWGTEAGWKHKKKSKAKDMNWRMTFINSISMNRVFYPKQRFEAMAKPKVLDI